MVSHLVRLKHALVMFVSRWLPGNCQVQSLRWRHAVSLMQRASCALLEADMITLTLMTGGTNGPMGRVGLGQKVLERC